jgi:signal transduction histidine kinase
MPTRDPHERSSTDEGLQSERNKTDAEIEKRARALGEVATELVSEARDKADSILDRARDLADLKSEPSTQTEQARARADAVVRAERRGADAAARGEIELRRIALASLLAFERQDTDLRLEVERKRSDQALASREDFMAMVSHDLRSLLGGIALSAEMLAEVEGMDQPFVQVARHAERIQRFSARMTRLVGDLMDVVSIEAGKLSLLRSPCDTKQLLHDAQDAFSLATKGAGVELVCRSEADPGVVELDHERIMQVLTNLVGNALKFTPRGGRITIEVANREDVIGFSVADTGSGIPTALLDKIFERYFQSADGDRRGLGLGLFISKSIVEAHGGKIWATSTPGQGSTISFTVPIARAS